MGAYDEMLYLENLSKNITKAQKIEMIENLGKLKSRKAISELTRIARNEMEDEKIRAKAILSLTEIGDLNFVKNFFPLVEQEDKEILEMILIAIRELNIYYAIPELEKFFKSKDNNIKKEVIETLAKFNTLESVKVLLKIYSNGDNFIKSEIRYYLKESESFESFLNDSDELTLLNFITLIPKEKAEILLRKKIETTEDEELLILIVKSIGELKLKNILEILEKIYKSTESKKLKSIIIENIAKISDKGKIEFLFSVLDSADRDLKAKAILALESNKTNKAVINKLVDVMKNRDEWWMNRKLAIITLEHIDNKEYFEALIEMIKEEDDNRILRNVISALGDARKKIAIPYIEGYINNSNLELKKVVIIALSKLGDEKVLGMLVEDRSLIETLFPESIKAILNFKDERVEEVILGILKSRQEKVLDVILGEIADRESREIKDELLKIALDKLVSREIRAKTLMILSSYKSELLDNGIDVILSDIEEWWMIKKIALLIIGEQKMYKKYSTIIKYANDIDKRMSNTARQVAKDFYKYYFLEELSKENSSMLEIAKDIAELI
ncbi:HEAT repeat domain-containing protein [Haliovirga abyssi]|uniref:HEAT repeat domain-containing protein n=1 Tax=Haliovirga abyssi TaxID=2996794 RepID=A0AAU9DJF4_9FUSO|nr:HEAT repeat domain-containing protein [Haliovirga abyssi]BDU50969.1 hypothetical protein HLVA_15380 [Haliovirga abyssi]